MGVHIFFSLLCARVYIFTALLCARVYIIFSSVRECVRGRECLRACPSYCLLKHFNTLPFPRHIITTHCLACCCCCFSCALFAGGFIGNALGSNGKNYVLWGEAQTMIYLKISLSDFLTLFAARTRTWFWERRPG